MLSTTNIVLCFAVVLGVSAVPGVRLFFNSYHLYSALMSHYAFTKDAIRYCSLVTLIVHIKFPHYCNTFCSYLVKCKSGWWMKITRNFLVYKYVYVAYTILILNKISIQAVCNVNAFLSTLIIITEAYVCKILLNPMFLNIEFTRTL